MITRSASSKSKSPSDKAVAESGHDPFASQPPYGASIREPARFNHLVCELRDLLTDWRGSEQELVYLYLTPLWRSRAHRWLEGS